MSITGYERQQYSDVHRIADALEAIATTLEEVRVEIKRSRIETENLTNTLKEIKHD